MPAIVEIELFRQYKDIYKWNGSVNEITLRQDNRRHGGGSEEVVDDKLTRWRTQSGNCGGGTQLDCGGQGRDWGYSAEIWHGANVQKNLIAFSHSLWRRRRGRVVKYPRKNCSLIQYHLLWKLNSTLQLWENTNKKELREHLPVGSISPPYGMGSEDHCHWIEWV